MHAHALIAFDAAFMTNARKKKSKGLDEPFDLQTLASVQHKLPRGQSSLPKEQALHAQKVRLIHGVAQAVAEKGYAATTVADITAKAAVSRTTFYELFKDKEACFLFGLRSTSGTHLKLVRKAYTLQDHPAQQMVQAIHAYLAFPELDKVFATAFVVQTDGISAAVDALMAELMANFATEIKHWLGQAQQLYPDIAAPSDLRYELLTSAIWDFLKTRVRQARTAREDEFDELLGFIFLALGLPAWAKRVRAGAKTGAKTWGRPLR